MILLIGGGKAYFYRDGRHIGCREQEETSRPVVTGLDLCPRHHRSRSLPPSPPVSSFAPVTTGLELAPVTTGLELVPVVIAIAGAGDGDRTEEDIEKRGKGRRRRRQQRD
ncbi:hypothetical protein DY000_02016085 [Brassica cretica]|uniref:Uncharacterized protein n=1 Tax=Brassica cretica TaxID=69181 RepID=A0ABQ7CTP1_BRACR|nr:hypothetical protein DY000_02016085 [Brassica cretica]